MKKKPKTEIIKDEEILATPGRERDKLDLYDRIGNILLGGVFGFIYIHILLFFLHH